MSYQLVVSEKPSVGAAYAKVLGATNRQDGYWEGNGYLVSWCVGHLVELAPPNVYDAKYVKWSIADLPILPQKWQYLVSASTKKQFGILQKLMHRPDVDSVICATDAGREGELIFRLVYRQAGCKKPFSRLWLSSMEENAIREGFASLKPSTEYDALYQAALCRERADWMVGINASRLFSCLYGQPLAVGRVMTPVLAMTVVREAAIVAFVPEKFYTVDLELTSGCTASSRRIPEKSVAENLLEACRREMVATIQRITRKEKSENPPRCGRPEIHPLHPHDAGCLRGAAGCPHGVAHCQPCCACQRAAGQGFFRQLCGIFGTAAVVHRADGQSIQRSAHQTLSIRPFCALWGAGWPYFYSIILRGISLHL